MVSFFFLYTMKVMYLLDYGMSSKMTAHIERKNTTSLTKADDYKSVAAAYMKTVNACK